ncbi:MAG: hypothetical protein H7Y11_08605 [Armatimonadetes bacterium]|nr:hypothetical protein [Anaerolineae bacterium]
MAIDITQLDEADLLSALGDGDWLIAMPTGYEALTVSIAWHAEFVASVGTQFVRWVLNGKRYEIDYDNDPPWDHSGDMQPQNSDRMLLRALYSTLGEWLTAEYTGQWRPTYESNYGKHWESYEDVATQQVGERLSYLFRSQYVAQFAASVDDMEDTIWDDLAFVMVNLEHALMMLVGRISTTDAWQRYEALTYAQIAEEQRLSAERTALYQQSQARVQQFWQTYFPDLNRTKIERPQFIALKLEARLRELFLDTDPETIMAIAELGLPANFSNSVRDIVKALARAALD